MDELVSHLAETNLFRGLTADQIGSVLSMARKVTFRKDDVIMEEGKIGDTMYIILEGTVEVIKRLTMQGIEDDLDGKSKVFTKLGSEHHHIFGEIALLEESERTATVRALSDCVFYEIRKEDFLSLAESNHELGYRIILNLARIMGSRLRKVNEDTVKLTTVLSLVLKEA
jgi:CRP/FNR family cyclic AMP-dependent transcriptional regulator